MMKAISPPRRSRAGVPVSKIRRRIPRNMTAAPSERAARRPLASVQQRRTLGGQTAIERSAAMDPDEKTMQTMQAAMKAAPANAATRLMTEGYV